MAVYRPGLIVHSAYDNLDGKFRPKECLLQFKIALSRLFSSSRVYVSRGNLIFIHFNALSDRVNLGHYKRARRFRNYLEDKSSVANVPFPRVSRGEMNRGTEASSNRLHQLLWHNKFRHCRRSVGIDRKISAQSRLCP